MSWLSWVMMEYSEELLKLAEQFEPELSTFRGKGLNDCLFVFLSCSLTFVIFFFFVILRLLRMIFFLIQMPLSPFPSLYTLVLYVQFWSKVPVPEELFISMICDPG